MEFQYQVANRRQGELYGSLDTFLNNRGDNRIQCFCIRLLFVDFESPRELIDDHYRVITWIHHAIRCKVEELDLDFTVFSMTIFAFLSCILLCPSLRSLSLNLRGTTLQILKRRTSLMISAPNLKKLKMVGHLTNRLTFWKHTTLEKAENLLWPKANECGNIFEVLGSVCIAKTVILNDQATKALLGKGSVTEPLHDICNLGLHLRSLNDDIVPAVVSLFRAVTNLNTLHIKCSIFAGGGQCDSSTFDTYFWKMQNLGFIIQLKEVTIEPYGPKENEFANYILEHAQNLKKMVISYLKEKQSDVVAGMVSKSNMISSTAKVVIRESRQACLS